MLAVDRLDAVPAKGIAGRVDAGVIGFAGGDQVILVVPDLGCKGYFNTIRQASYDTATQRGIPTEFFQWDAVQHIVFMHIFTHKHRTDILNPAKSKILSLML